MSIISQALSRGVHRKILEAKKQSPHIFFGAGIAGFIGTTVLASRATLKLPGIMTDIEQNVESFKDPVQLDGDYTEKDRKRDLVFVYGRSAATIGKLYGPTVVVGGLSVAALTGAHVTLTRRNTALSAAFYAVNKAFEDYRERVRDELGEERELDISRAAHDRKVKDETGKNDTVKVVNSNLYSMYARIFDEGNINYVKDAASNKLFITCQQNYWNMKLQVRGHVFLNEVYESLGFDHTPYGAMLGWVYGPEGKDNFIDFGMFEGVDASANAFVNGWERAIVLDFNVDGQIYDLI